MGRQLYLKFFDPSLGTPSVEARRDYLDPTNPVSPYFGFIGNRRAVDRLIRIDFEALGRYNHACNDLNIAFIGQAGCGKAQTLDAKIYTPSGPKTMGEIKVGDTVCTPDGNTASVIGIFPQGNKPVYRIFFKDGSSTECCENHLWKIENIYNKWSDGLRIVDTKYLVNNCKSGNRNVLAIPVTQAVNFDLRNIKIDPYVLGALLGDGSFANNNCLRFANTDEEMINLIKNKLIIGHEVKHDKGCNYRIIKTQRDNKPTNYVIALKEYCLWGLKSSDKFVPEDYLFNTFDIRLNLLKGLMDTDGHVSKTGGIYYYSTSKKLAQNVKFLVESLGGLCRIYDKQTTYKYKGINKLGKLCYVCSIKFNNPEELFTLTRKQKLTKKRTKYAVKRIIESVELVGTKQTQCILIDHKDHLYLTDDFIVTHNTDLAHRHAKTNKLPLVEISPKSVKQTHDVFKIIQRVCGECKLPLVEVDRDNNYILPPINVFIDEVHALATPVVNGLLKATEHNDRILVTEKGVTVNCKNVHWMIATTDRGKLFDAFDTRFTKCILNLYTKDEVARIVQVNNPTWDVRACNLVAHFCGRVPREALAFAREMQLERNMNPCENWGNVAHVVARDNEIDPFGMSYKRLAILKALGHGPVAEKRLAVMVGCKHEELTKFIMPWLLADTDDQKALVTVTTRGYTITESGLKELNLRHIHKESAVSA